MRESCIRENQMSQNHNKDQAHQKKTRYLIQNTNNFQYYETLKMLVSEPLKYLGLHAVILCGMAYFYILTFVTGNIVIEINYTIVALHILVFIFLLTLGFKNPGIFLKISEDFQTNTKLQIPFNRDSKPAINQLAKSYAFPIKSHFITLKFCPQCLIYKPPRAVHCWTCNACIDKMDHHCPFIGNCVGKGNYQIFFCFITSLIFMLILIIAQLVILVVKLFQRDEINGFKKPELYFALILCTSGYIQVFFTVIALVFVSSLGGFHIYLIVNSLTTNQLCKEKWTSVSGNPFKKTFCLKNVFRFITGPANEKVISDAQQLQKSVVPRFNNKSEQYQSSQYQISQQPQYLVKELHRMPRKPQQNIEKQEGAITQQQFLKPENIQAP